MTTWMSAGDLGQSSVHQFSHQAAPHTHKTSLLGLGLMTSVVDLAKTQTGFSVLTNCVHCPWVLPVTKPQLTGHSNV